ncbi:unnamed protein product [Prunus armeniaca]|uniref:Uncharacterized protein n=1 Tax=Prunus armeniaca TaxID=36596 RepID=A0A6J5TZ73_PRUAR|nr:unnamed protein product [Prunus armeniaca]
MWVPGAAFHEQGGGECGARSHQHVGPTESEKEAQSEWVPTDTAHPPSFPPPAAYHIILLSLSHCPPLPRPSPSLLQLRNERENSETRERERESFEGLSACLALYALSNPNTDSSVTNTTMRFVLQARFIFMESSHLLSGLKT